MFQVGTRIKEIVFMSLGSPIVNQGLQDVVLPVSFLGLACILWAPQKICQNLEQLIDSLA